MAVSGIDLGKYKLGWSDSTDDYAFIPKKGLNEEIVREISGQKNEPDWMRDFRLKALKRFERKPMLEWFAKNMPTIDFDDIYYYLKPTDKGQVADWDMLPESMKATYEKLGIPEAERKYLAGVTAQYESEVVYHRNREDLEKQGILFCDMDTAVLEYPDIVRRYFGKHIRSVQFHHVVDKFVDTFFLAINGQIPVTKSIQPLYEVFRLLLLGCIKCGLCAKRNGDT